MFLLGPTYGITTYQNLRLGVCGPHYDHLFSSVNQAITKTKLLFCLSVRYLTRCNIDHTAHNLHTQLTTYNLPSSILNHALSSECANNRILEPFFSPPLPNLCCSGLSIIPNNEGEWGMIDHLSALLSNGINDFIDLTTYTLIYYFTDDTYAQAMSIKLT